MRRRLLAILLGLVALLMLPWTVWLTVTLPSEHVARHWDTAWVGFDALEMSALLATAYALVRRTSWLAVAAAVAGTLLLCDAWFDVLLSGGEERLWLAVVEAVFAEVPLAVVCFWIAAQPGRDVRRRQPS